LAGRNVREFLKDYKYAAVPHRTLYSAKNWWFKAGKTMPAKTGFGNTQSGGDIKIRQET
jgi:hypothetical protein